MSRRSVVVAVGVLAVMIVSGLVLAVYLAASDSRGFAFGGRVALLEVDGMITDDAPYLEQIRELRDDRSVRAFVVRVNSPGGVVGPAQSLYRELRRIRDEDGRPVVASIGATGASGGYYLALGADSIFALPGSLTGSIGVIIEFPNVVGLMDKVGVRMEVVKSAEHKDIGSPFRPLGPADREVLDGLVSDVYDQFIDAVARERDLPAAEVRRLADGRVLSGQQALEAGLVDRLGNLNDALAAAGGMAGLGDRPRLRRPARDGPTLLEVLLGRRVAGALARAARPLEEGTGPRVQYRIPW